MQEWIAPAYQLWTIVRESLKIEAFRQLGKEEQAFKDVLRRKLNSGRLHEFQEKMVELEERIKNSNVFHKLQKTLNAMEVGVLKQELKIFKNVIGIYEKRMSESVQTCSLVEEKIHLYEKQLETNVMQQDRRLLIEEFRNGNDQCHFVLSWMQVRYKSFDFMLKIEKQIEFLIDRSNEDLCALLQQNVAIADSRKVIIRNMCEIEIAENFVHLTYMDEGMQSVEMPGYQGSLDATVRVTKEMLQSTEKSVDCAKVDLEKYRELLTVPQSMTKTYDDELFKELFEVTQKHISTRLSAVSLKEKLFKMESTVFANLATNDCLQMESIRGLAEVKNFFGMTNDDTLKTELVGFVCDHLKFRSPTVAALATPRLIDILTLVIFRKQATIMRLLKILPPQNVYTFFALDSISTEVLEKPTEVPPVCFPLADLLSDSPLRSALKYLLRQHYYTDYATAEVMATRNTLPDTTVFCVKEGLILSDGLIIGGFVPSADIFTDTLVESVELSTEAIQHRQRIRDELNASAEFEKHRNHILKMMLFAGQDSFSRFSGLYRSCVQWSEIPTLITQISEQTHLLLRQESRVELWSKFLIELKLGQLRDIDDCAQRIKEQKNMMEKHTRDMHQLEVTHAKLLAEFKDNLRLLRELLIYAESLRDFYTRPDFQEQLLVYWKEYGYKMLKSCERLQNDLAEPDTLDVLDKMDHLERDACVAKRKILQFDALLRGSDRFYHEFREQVINKIKILNPAQFVVRPCELQHLYESKKQLNSSNTQPGYKKSEIDRIKRKLDLLREHKRLAASYRTPHLTNMTLSCMEKLAVIKLRLITNMMAQIPVFAGEARKLGLHFQYDQTKYLPGEEDDPKMHLFSIQNIVGLSVGVIDGERTRFSNLLDRKVLAHLIFFVCFLSLEKCKLLFLNDCFTGLTDEEQEQIHNILQILSRNMQIFVSERSK
ncbi:uncharacterized protein LOC129774454 [Toxorhynchites rutilus septentrionalis]|uniref:uncharacterized protein LOC129774454 n=1 Tax=Toxorhynchites rutilus septentrionalis TaxID=329112 RepID=UPI0024785C42|nr:uncharacterized protein LOC129774454 [Toxorhynchites rutilus septentrionalis]